MFNFTLGPVMSEPKILEVANHSAPYFRTPEFSEVMKENEKLILEFLMAPHQSRCVFFTSSGTGAMESCVMNVLSEEDRIIVINGGSFGHRFVKMCELHKRNYTEVKCGFGKQLKKEQLRGLEQHTALLINMHETSSGLLYDIKMISDFCKKNNILLIVDAISSFLSDELDMETLEVDAVIIGSQKALAVQAGVSIVALSPRAIRRIEANEERCMYLSMREALKDGDRGQTPFTPAVTTMLQINTRLHKIYQAGVESERKKIISVATKFREKVFGLPFELVAECPSNALTTLKPINGGAKRIVDILKAEYGIWVCPNGGELADVVFRVGHIGYITDDAIDALIEALYDMNNRGLL